MKTSVLCAVLVCAVFLGAAPATAGEQSIVMNKTGKQINVEVQGAQVNLPEGGTYEVRGSWGFSVRGPHTCIGGRYADGSCTKWGPEFRCDYHDWNRRGHALEKGLYIVRFTRQPRAHNDNQKCDITRYYPYS